MKKLFTILTLLLTTALALSQQFVELNVDNPNGNEMSFADSSKTIHNSDNDIVISTTQDGLDVMQNETPIVDDQSKGYSWPTVKEKHPMVLKMIDQVDKDRLQATVQHMQDYGERWYKGTHITQARDWIANEMRALGLDVEIQNFKCPDNTMCYNIIGIQRGALYPNKYVVCGGHYDTSQGSPGADDNATGVATVLESARILTQYEFEYSIVYCVFSAEDVQPLGCYGSEAYANRCKDRGMEIIGYFNNDMNGYLKQGLDIHINCLRYDIDSSFGNYYLTVGNIYFPEMAINTYSQNTLESSYGLTSDLKSFNKVGYKCIHPTEDFENNTINPHFGSSNDIIGKGVNNFDMSKRFTQMNIASIAHLAIPCEIIIGDGNSSTYIVPFNNLYKNSWTETIYPKEDFGAPCMINSISYYCSTSKSYTCSELKIYMGERSSTKYSSDYDWTPLTDLQLVYHGKNITIGGKTGWQEFELATPFDYTKAENLVIAISKTAPSWSSSLKWDFTYSTKASMDRGNDYDASYANHPGTAKGSRSNCKPNIRLRTSTPCIIGNGNATTYYAPFNNYYHYSWNESIYPKDSFNSQCIINSISFDCATASSYNCEELNIYMGERNSDNYMTTTDWTPLSDLQLVYSGSNVTIGSETGWQKFVLDNPFYYSNNDNLVVVVAKKANKWSPYPKWKCTYSNKNSLGRSDDYDKSYASHPDNSSGYYTDAANIKLGIVADGQIGFGNGTSYVSPFNNFWRHSWTECIYDKSEIHETGTITSVSYYCAVPYTYTIDNKFEIYIGERASSKHSKDTDWTRIDDLELVYSRSNVTIGSTKGWQKFVLDSPYDYSGDKNLVIVIAKSASSYSSSSLVWNKTNKSDACLYRRSDSDNSYSNYPKKFLGWFLFYSGELSDIRANVKLSMMPDNSKSGEVEVILGEETYPEIENETAEEPVSGDDIRIFPNPAQNVINIEMEDNNFEYVIYNELGQVVRQGSSCGKSQINVEDCHKGLYFIRIATGEKTSIHKIIIE